MNNIFKRSIFFLSIVGFPILLTTAANAKLRDMETTRLISTSGAGVGSILINEAAFLNPASIYFFKESSIYYQKGTAELSDKAQSREGNYKDGLNEALLITDTSSRLRGALSYQYQTENGESRKRLTNSVSTNLGRNASFGILYRYTEDDTLEGHKVYHQGTLGLTYVMNEKMAMGAILVDPFLANKEDARVVAGIQYSATQNFLILADAGADYNENPEENNFWKAAAQAQFFRRFFLKYGKFDDKIQHLRGDSWGISWIGPRIGLEYAYRKSRAFEESENFFEGEELEEHSFALSLVF